MELPYPVTVLEWSTDQTNIPVGDRYSKVVMILQDEDPWIKLNIAIYLPALDLWAISPYVKIYKTDYSPREIDGRHVISTRLQFEASDPIIQEYQYEISVMFDFLNALSYNNVRIEKENPTKQPKKKLIKQKKGKIKTKPFDTYRYLVIDCPNDRTISTSPVDSHRGGTSPREHTRRGHPRRYKEGIS